MTTLADQAILSSANNRSPMLEKDMYDIWKSRMELYMMNRQHERMILESVKNGLLIWPTIEENGGTSRTHTPAASASNSEKHKTIICYNCKGEGHMSKQCTKPKRKRDDSWFKDKVLLVQAQANGQILHEEELAFLADPGIAKGQATQTVITHNVAYQANELLTPPPSVDHSAPRVIAVIVKVVAPEPAASTGSHSSTTIDQDAPSPSNSQTAPKIQSPFISNDVEEDNHDLDVEHMNNDPFFGVEESPKTPTFRDDPLHESLYENSTSQGS
uniref:Retrovirus-related Pol polyprotein from transposon TNT 1-94 n=1 Tax=Tanacetum cinerariifolium TaxID=118510 RepID=A0A6L2KZZ4_TANCI|nr:retrovirus-related Pol polyprotein from transposon TNT 1-94 [Tanacetum cinerariifolium]